MDVIIRILCTALSLILILAFNGEMATAEDSMNRQSMELFYLTPVQQKRFESLSPEEQEQLIRNYRDYQRLPQSQREKLKNNYNQWKKNSPEERQKLKKLYEKYKRKAPQRRRHRR